MVPAPRMKNPMGSKESDFRPAIFNVSEYMKAVRIKRALLNTSKDGFEAINLAEYISSWVGRKYLNSSMIMTSKIKITKNIIYVFCLNFSLEKVFKLGAKSADTTHEMANVIAPTV